MEILRWIVLKAISSVVFLRYPTMTGKYRWFVRNGMIGRLNQMKFWVRDRYSKRPYKIIKYEGEFAPELKFILPHAYWHYLNGTLKKTISAKDTQSFYFFSEDHQEEYESRIWSNFNYDHSLPNSEDHNVDYDYRKWAMVPLKEKYKNNVFTFEKPMLVISNKYNTEWNSAPINFLDLDTLSWIFDLLQSNYQLIYNRPRSSKIVSDNSQLLDLGDHQMIRDNYPDIILLEDLQKEHVSIRSFNHLQLMVYANADRFISVQGGNSILASYFEGTNIVYAKKGHELFFNEFSTIYPKLSGAKIRVEQTYGKLKKTIVDEFAD